MAMFLFILPFRNRAGQKLMNWGDCKKLPWDIVLVLGGGMSLLASTFESHN
jgi:sodium-dependent dicarboxylate transporter 2/3/5